MINDIVKVTEESDEDMGIAVPFKNKVIVES